MARANKALDTSNTTVEVLEELTPDEERERQRLEWKVEKAFYEAGASLRLLRDKKLYRSTHKTFEAYCHYRFGYNRSRSYQLIDAAGVVENLQECPQFVNVLTPIRITMSSINQVKPSPATACMECFT